MGFRSAQLGYQAAIRQPGERLLADTQLADDIAVAVRVGLLEVIQKTAALRYEHQQATARAMVFFVSLEVFREFADALRKDRDLHLRTSGVRVVRAELGDNV